MGSYISKNIYKFFPQSKTKIRFKKNKKKNTIFTNVVKRHSCFVHRLHVVLKLFVRDQFRPPFHIEHARMGCIP